VNGMAIGPKNNLLYVIATPYDNETQWNVYRINRTTGSLHEPVFINLLQSNVDYPNDIAFGYDGNLYVLNYARVVRYNANTGAYMGVFVEWGDYNYYPTFSGMLFSNTDEVLYVSTSGANIYSFNGTTGARIHYIFSANIVQYIPYICQDSNGYLYIPNLLKFPFNCQAGFGGVLRYRPNIDPVPQPFITTGNGIIPYSCQVGIGSMNQTLIVADPCHQQFRLYNLETGTLTSLAPTKESPARFIDWNDVASN